MIFFLCKICFRTHRNIIWEKKTPKKIHTELTVREESGYQIRWIFGKCQIIFKPKIMSQILGTLQGFLIMKLIQNSNVRVQGMFFNNCIEKNQNKTHFEEGSRSHTSLRDGSRLPNRMNFRKGSKRQLTPAPHLRMVPISGYHVHAFHTIWPSYLHICNHIH